MENANKNTPMSQSCKNAVMPCFSNMWNETKESLPNINRSCLVLRKGSLLCNLYLNSNGEWRDDGYDSKQERVFKDVTHWMLLSDIPIPNKA